MFVTHDMGAIERFCDRAMLMERGKVVEHRRAGCDRASVQRAQLAAATARPRSPRLAPSSNGSSARRRSREIVGAVFESDRRRDDRSTANQGEPCPCGSTSRFHAEWTNPIFAIGLLRNDAGHGVFAASTVAQPAPTGHFAAGQDVLVRIQFENWLGPGRYRLTASVARAARGDDVIDRHETAARSSSTPSGRRR